MPKINKIISCNYHLLKVISLIFKAIHITDSPTIVNDTVLKYARTNCMVDDAFLKKIEKH